MFCDSRILQAVLSATERQPVPKIQNSTSTTSAVLDEYLPPQQPAHQALLAAYIVICKLTVWLTFRSYIQIYNLRLILTITSNLSKAHETRDSLSKSCSQVVQIHFQPCRRNSLLKCVPQSKIAINTRTFYFRSSESFEVINVDTIKKLVTSACYDKQYVYFCNFFHAKIASSSEITTF